MSHPESPRDHHLPFRVFKEIQRALRGTGLGQIAVLRNVRDAVYQIVRPRHLVLLQVQGVTMELNPAQMGVVPELLRDGVFEQCETDLIRSILKPGHVFVDIGGNIGYYSLIAANIVGPSGWVYSFEPEPSNFGFLKRNVELNGFGNITLERFALSNKRGTAQLFLHSIDSGGHHLYDPGTGEGSVAVETITLDEYLKGKERPIDLIKMDIEGFEPVALEGMKTVLAANHGVRLLTEFYPRMISAAGASPKEYFKALEQLGFRVSLINEAQNVVDRATEAEIFAYCDRHLYANLLCERPG